MAFGSLSERSILALCAWRFFFLTFFAACLRNLPGRVHLAGDKLVQGMQEVGFFAACFLPISRSARCCFSRVNSSSRRTIFFFFGGGGGEGGGLGGGGGGDGGGGHSIRAILSVSSSRAILSATPSRSHAAKALVSRVSRPTSTLHEKLRDHWRFIFFNTRL
jgi:hypothetical protein